MYLALGSNLGDRLALLRAAVGELGRSIQVVAVSPVYETDAVAAEPQPAYLNAALRARTDLPPRRLLELCLSVERRLGRVRPPGRARAPRPIDVDLLLHGALVVEQPDLRIPHPGLLDRPFVRVPLARVATPGLRHPATGDRLDGAAPDPGVRLFGELALAPGPGAR